MVDYAQWHSIVVVFSLDTESFDWILENKSHCAFIWGWLICATPQLGLWSGLLQEDSCWVIRINISAKHIRKYNKKVILISQTKITWCIMSLTHVSSFHQLECSLLAGDLYELLVQSSFVDCIASLKRSNWEKVEQRFHSPLPWTKSWMSVRSRVPYSHSLELPEISYQEDKLI